MAATENEMKTPMTTGPGGVKRPRDPAACALHVVRIATGELPNDSPRKASGAMTDRGRDGAPDRGRSGR